MPQRQQDTWSNEEPPSKSACSLLRPYRVQLIERMGLTQALSLTDRLYQMHIISHSEMETVQNCSWPTYGGGTAPRRLLSLLEGRTWDNIKDFARLLQKTEGLTDIGDALLCRVASTGKSYHCISVWHEHVCDRDIAPTFCLACSYVYLDEF